ncbi:MAG: DUF2147 domain-containing protein [Cyclobacteriaceae bacterium]|nr:DUF2147 domain-containing protein [Cyclobacteriaceae bacterium]
MKTLVIIFLLGGNLALAQNSLIGRWKTVDDATGEEKSIVEIFERSGKVFGKIIRIFPEPDQDPDPVCDQCSVDDPRYKKKIIGMEIIQDMVKNGEELSDGNILDPEVGKVYRCKIWLEGNNLKVRGYWGPFYRTQTWKKV